MLLRGSDIQAQGFDLQIHLRKMRNYSYKMNQGSRRNIRSFMSFHRHSPSAVLRKRRGGCATCFMLRQFLSLDDRRYLLANYWLVNVTRELYQSSHEF